jgi:hypothetical protein
VGDVATELAGGASSIEYKKPAHDCAGLLHMTHTKTWDFLVVAILLSWDVRPIPEFSASGSDDRPPIAAEALFQL